MATSFSSMLDPWIGGVNEQIFASTGSIMSSNDLWTVNECQFDMPTPPVSPSHNDMIEVKREPITATTTPQTTTTTAPIEEDLDLGLGELISGLDLPSGLFLDDPDSWFSDVFQTTDSSSSSVADVVLDTKCEVNELRHDCMWAGHCPAEEHRSKKDLVQLPCLLSSSPPESTVLSMANLPLVLQQPTATAAIAGGNRTRLDTFGSTRPETPLSLSDSELDADQLTSDEGGNNKGNSSSSSSSSADESESDEDRPMIYQPTLPPNIHPVRSHQIRKLQIQNKSLVKMVMSSSSSLIPDHSYSHSDHSYHTQRRPINNDLMANPFDLGAPTPSDSEEEIDVVSLGEVLRMNPSGTMTTSLNSSSKSLASSVSTLGSANNSHAPLRLKLKVAPASAVSSSSAAAAIVNSSSASGQVLMRKALPSHPSALVRQQLQLAVASAAQQRRHSESTKKSSGEMKMSGKNGCSSSSKRPRSSGESGSSSPRKRCSRAPSDSEDSCEKRSQHNSMERQRRVDLRNAFEFLRSLIPDLEATDRAAKVVILKKAANFCQGLTQREKQFVADKDSLQKRQEMLRKRLAMLQRRR